MEIRTGLGSNQEQNCENCGFGVFTILEAKLWDIQNEIITVTELDSGGWYRIDDVSPLSEFTVVQGKAPINNVWVIIQEIEGGPELYFIRGITNLNGRTSISLPALSCIFIDENIQLRVMQNCEELRFRLRIEPHTTSTFQFDPFEVIQRMEVNPNPEENSIFIPVTIPLQTKSHVSNCELYDRILMKEGAIYKEEKFEKIFYSISTITSKDFWI